MSRWIVVGFAILAWAWLGSGRGDDLSASYIGCRLIHAGQGDSLFSHDASDFAVVRDPAWTRAAGTAGFTGMLHPYVQTPLWAFLLQPLCLPMGFTRFRQAFVLLSLLSLGATVLLVVRHWTRLQEQAATALALAALCLTQPFHYALFLGQTHALFLFLTVLALILAPRGRPFAAGAALAAASMVKITPGFLALYWLIIGERRAAGAFLAAMLALGGLTVLSVGPALTAAYVRELARISDVLLVAYNNQSLAGWWGGRHAAWPEIHAWRMQAMPPGLKLLSVALTLAATVLGGLLDRRGPAQAPVGAIFALLAATIFTPIAWSHYAIVLVIPAILFVDRGATRGEAWPLALAVTLLLCNVAPLGGGRAPGLLLRGQFFSTVLALAGLGALALRSRHDQTPQVYTPGRANRARSAGRIEAAKRRRPAS